MALSAQNQSTSYVNLYYSIVQRAATRYFKEYYNSGEYLAPRACHTHAPRTRTRRSARFTFSSSLANVIVRHRVPVIPPARSRPRFAETSRRHRASRRTVIHAASSFPAGPPSRFPPSRARRESVFLTSPSFRKPTRTAGNFQSFRFPLPSTLRTREK